MANTLLPVIRATFRDPNTDLPLVGGKVYTYDAGTVTPRPSYTDDTLAFPNTNPVILDSAGQADIWLDGFYHIVVDDANDVQLYDTDNVSMGDLVLPASTSVAGKVRFATIAEQVAGLPLSPDAASTPEGVAARTRFDILPVKTPTLALTDTIAITDSATSDDNARITFNDMVNQVADLISSGSAGVPTVFSGMLVDRAYAEYTSMALLSSIIPQDNTVPQISEGTNILSLSITPKKTTNRLRVRFAGTHNPSTNATSIAALFINGGPSATRIVTGQSANNTQNMGNNLVMEYEFVPGVVTPIAIQINAGSRAANYSLNDGVDQYGGGSIQGATLIVEELDPLALSSTEPFVVSDITGITGADRIFNMVSLTAAEYAAIAVPDPATLYVIVG